MSIGNLGGFAGPFAIGALREGTNGFLIPLLAIAAILLAGTVPIALIGDPAAPRRRTESQTGSILEAQAAAPGLPMVSHLRVLVRDRFVS